MSTYIGAMPPRMPELPKSDIGMVLLTIEQMKASGSWDVPTLTRLGEIVAGFESQCVPNKRESGSTRNIAEAALRVASMTDKEIRLFAQRDPDIFRDVARAFLGETK